MKYIILVFSAVVTQASFGQMIAGWGITGGCITPNTNGKLNYNSGFEGCTEKSRKTAKDGETVTYQMVFPSFGKDGKAKPHVLTQTIKTTHEKGRLHTITQSAGESIDKADQSYTTEFSTSAQQSPNLISRMLVTQKENGKNQTYVTYDRNLCARLREGDIAGMDSELLTLCSQTIQKYQDAVNEWNAKLAKENKKLGWQMAQYGGGPTKVYEVSGGKLMDVMGIASTCQMYSGSQYPPIQQMMPEKVPMDKEEMPGSDQKYYQEAPADGMREKKRGQGV